MSETWRRWEGRTVNGRFPLQSYLGGSDHSAVFLTLAPGGADDSEKAAIKLLSADDADAEKQLARWKAVRERNHLNLIRIFEAGRCELEGTALLYVVMEYAEENLSQILPERALTAEETRGMLPPVLRGLQFVHGHGRIQPSNILAIGDQVKLSSDTLSVPGERSRGAQATSAYDPPESATGAISTPTDVWQLGMTLIEVLTQHLPVWDRALSNAPQVPAAVPEPFREIAWQCLQVDAGKRWTVAEIAEQLETEGAVPISAQTETAASAAAISGWQKASKTWSYLLVLAAVVAIAFVLILRLKRPGPKFEAPSTRAQQAAENSQAAPAQPEPNPSSAAPAETKIEGVATATGGNEQGSANAGEGAVLQRVMPQVSPSARRTIQGKIKVRVKVNVDAAGKVAKATLESAGPSKYFSRVALEAAREWKFSPARTGEQGADREWKLQFAFSRAKTEVSAVPAKRERVVSRSRD
jgi:TonB family protein